MTGTRGVATALIVALLGLGCREPEGEPPHFCYDDDDCQPASPRAYMVPENVTCRPNDRGDLDCRECLTDTECPVGATCFDENYCWAPESKDMGTDD